jgi:hypothetical protein
MAKFNHISSMEQYPLHDRLFMILKLAAGPSLELFKDGRPATDPEIGTALWQYHQALVEAERQIRKMAELLDELNPAEYESEDYLEEFPDNENTLGYLIQEAQAALFEAMARQDEPKISKWINRVNLLKEKEAQNA